MKKFLCILLILISFTGCHDNNAKLDGKDLIAYNLMLEVCYKANDPSKVQVISGTVASDMGVFKVSYNNGEDIYNILVSEKNGKYVAEKLHSQVVSMYSDLLYATDSFNISKVNKALNKKWNN